MKTPVLFFDGVCNFCDASVQFVLAHEEQPSLRFAPLQSPVGESIMQQHHVTVDSVVLLDDDGLHVRSAAVVRAARHLRYPYRAIAWLWWVPSPVRDLGYAAFAALRYRLFGKRDACKVPSAAERARFISTAEDL